MIWIGEGVLRVSGKNYGNGEEFPDELVDPETLEKLIEEKKVGEKVKVKTVALKSKKEKEKGKE